MSKVKVTIVDSIMGSQKTRSKIKEMSKNKNEKYLYITPFLDEVERVIKHTTCKMYEPKHNGVGKFNTLKKLAIKGFNIASTHVNLSSADDEFIKIIKSQQYNLVLDETMSVIEIMDITRQDTKMLIDSNYLIVNDDKTVYWNEDKKEGSEAYIGKFSDVKAIAKNSRLILARGVLLIWRFPIDIFQAFKSVTLLTYKFEGSLMKPYFEMYGQDYELKSMRDGKIVDYYNTRGVELKDKVNIYKGNLNDVGETVYSLSRSWHENNLKSGVKVLKNNVYNYFKHKIKSNGSKFIWSTFKGYKTELGGCGFRSAKTFCSIGMRATNKYKERTDLAYLVNNYINPLLKGFFQDNGVKVDEDEYALDLLLQWIWRSGIRDGKNINIYIPSRRMRNLLKDWLDNKESDK